MSHGESEVDMSGTIENLHKAARALNEHMGKRSHKPIYSAEVIVQKYMVFYNKFIGEQMQKRIRSGLGEGF